MPLVSRPHFRHMWRVWPQTRGAPPADWKDVPNSVYHVSGELFTLHQIPFQFIQPHFILHMKWRREGSEGEDGGENTSLQFVCMWSQLHISPCGRLLVRGGTCCSLSSISRFSWVISSISTHSRGLQEQLLLTVTHSDASKQWDLDFCSERVNLT